MIVIDCLFRNISPKPSSHWASWPHLRRAQWAKALGKTVTVNTEGLVPLDGVDELWLYHGMEWNEKAKVLGLTGGLSAEVIKSFEHFLSFNGVVRSMDVEMPDFGQLIKARADWSKFTSEEFLDRLSSRCLELRWAFPVVRDPRGSTLVIGDSHAISVAHPGAMCARMDFKTLNGALTENLQKTIQSFIQGQGTSPKTIVSYFGNIDVRHHLCRMYPTINYRHHQVDVMVQRYMDQLSLVRDSTLGISGITVVAPLPIENESRVLPKTGYYKDKPFWGTWAERNETRSYMTSKMLELAETYGIDVYLHPINYLNAQQELSFDVMEKPRSVHLSREFYAFDLENGMVNSKNVQGSEDVTRLLGAAA
jgi:hypothetical protein